MSFGAAPDVAGELERSLAAFDDAAHEGYLAYRAEVQAQTVTQALVYATDDDGAALIRGILRALHEASLDGVFRVTGTQGTAALLWMTSGNDGPKLRSTSLRDEAVGVLEGAGFDVTRTGCWDLSVSRRK